LRTCGAEAEAATSSVRKSPKKKAVEVVEAEEPTDEPTSTRFRQR
jgi:hypothetical protein